VDWLHVDYGYCKKNAYGMTETESLSFFLQMIGAGTLFGLIFSLLFSWAKF